MVEIELKKDEDGYEVVGNYIKRFWKHHSYCRVIVSLATSYDGKEYWDSKEIAEPMECFTDILYDMDWWEGERFIRLYGIMAVDDVKVEGGLYEEEL